jgi:sarcosine oxidase/L-pipecolate oxidase
MSTLGKSDPILIVGAGTFGLSTALHLLWSGFTNITVLDSSSSLPSSNSAGNDLNKIIRAEYENPFYVDAALEAIEKGWKTPLFAPYYHQTGYLMLCSGGASDKPVKSMQKARASVETHPFFKPGIQNAATREDLHRLAWQLDGPLRGFHGYFNPMAGYAHSGNAQRGLAEHLATQGVRFVLGGKAGTANKILCEGGRCIGAQTEDGQRRLANLTVCALGANNAALVPDISNFTVARCWAVVHIQLTDRECDILRGLPVINVRDLGFFFEPDPATKLLKLCHLGGAYSNTNSDGISLPPSTPVEDFIPAGDEAKLRQLLREALPWLAERPFVDKKMCWFSDSADSEYCIDFVPGTDKRLIALAGDSGHGFKMLPIMGKWVVELLQAGEQSRAQWRWKQGEAAKDWGSAVSWRVGKAQELRDVVQNEAPRLRAKL